METNPQIADHYFFFCIYFSLYLSFASYFHGKRLEVQSHHTYALGHTSSMCRVQPEGAAPIRTVIC